MAIWRPNVAIQRSHFSYRAPRRAIQRYQVAIHRRQVAIERRQVAIQRSQVALQRRQVAIQASGKDLGLLDSH